MEMQLNDIFACKTVAVCKRHNQCLVDWRAVLITDDAHRRFAWLRQRPGQRFPN